MSTHPLWLILFFVCSITGCSQDNSIPQTTPFNRMAAEREVYETIIEIPPDGSFVIRTPTSTFGATLMGDTPDEYREFLRESLPTLQDSTWRDMGTVGSEAVPFPDDLELGGPYRVITDEAWAEYFGSIDSTAWERFEATYDARAWGSYSRVAFNEEGSQALVYRGVVCGVLCGSGGYVLLEKVDGVWQVVGETEVWMS